MNRALVIFCIVVGLLGFSAVFAQEKGQSPEDMQKMMAEWQKWSTPGAEHQVLAKLAGDWKVHSKWWMSPDAQPMESDEGQKAELMWDGRYLKFETTGDMMGQPMHGLGFLGYDKFKGKYNMFWIDNSGTAMYTALGTADPTGKEITLTGSVDDPMTGEKNKEAKYVYHINDDGSVTFDIWDTKDGKSYKSAEMHLTK